MAELQAAWIGLSGPPVPGVLDDVDPARIGRDTPALVEWAEVIDRGQISWTNIPGPTDAWARLVYGESIRNPLEAFWADLAIICRLDEPDPEAAWRQRSAGLRRACERLESAGLDALRFRGPGTDLTVGLLAGVRWHGWGHADGPGQRSSPERADRGGLHQPRPRTHRVGRHLDQAAARRRSRTDARADPSRRRRQAVGRGGPGRRQRAVGRPGRVFHDTLLDENVACHVALGSGFPHLAAEGPAGDAERVNSSVVHTDFMIGGPDVELSGTTRDGCEIPVLVRGEWAL